MVRVGPQCSRKKYLNRPVYVKVDIFEGIKIINKYYEVEVLR